MWSVSVWVLTVNAARPPAYLFELSQPWRCWSPSCEVVSETLSLTHIIGQCFISHIHPTRAYTHTLIHTLTHTHTRTQTGDIADHTSYFLCVNLSSSFFSPSKLVLHVHTCSDSVLHKQLPGWFTKRCWALGLLVVGSFQMTDVHRCHKKPRVSSQRKWFSPLGLTPSVVSQLRLLRDEDCSTESACKKVDVKVKVWGIICWPLYTATAMLLHP